MRRNRNFDAADLKRRLVGDFESSQAQGEPLEIVLYRIWLDGDANGRFAVKASKPARRSGKSEGSKRIAFSKDDWRRLRYRVLQSAGGKCQCCGATAESSGHPLHVDHIKPKSLYPELALELSNLQVLCKDCNFGKSQWDETDWRKILPIGLEGSD